MKIIVDVGTAEKRGSVAIVLIPNAIKDVAVAWLSRRVQVVDSREVEQDWRQRRTT